MNIIDLVLLEHFELICIGSIFLLIFASTIVALKRASVFNGASLAVVSLCVAVLSIMGLIKFGVIKGPWKDSNVGTEGGSLLDLFLILYAVLGICLLFSIIILLVRAAFKKRKIKPPLEYRDEEIEDLLPFRGLYTPSDRQ